MSHVYRYSRSQSSHSGLYGLLFLIFYAVDDYLNGQEKNFFKSKKRGKDQESIQSSTTPYPGYHMESVKTKLNITNKSQEVSHFPAGDLKAAMNGHESMTNTRHK